MIGLDMSSHLTAKIPLEMSNIYIVHCWRRIACEWGLETADNEYFLPFRAVCILHLFVFFHNTRILYFICNIKCIFCFNFNMLFFISAFIVKDPVLIGYEVWILWKEILKQKYILPVSAETNDYVSSKIIEHINA